MAAVVFAAAGCGAPARVDAPPPQSATDCNDGLRTSRADALAPGAIRSAQAKLFPALLESQAPSRIPAGIEAPAQARAVRWFYPQLPMPPLADEGVLTLTLFVLKDWRHSVESCAGDGTGFLDLQLVLSTHPAQSILIHSLQGSAADSEVVAAGKSDRSPAPPMNALFHVFFGAPHALSEIAGVRTSDTEVAVYANTWLEERVAGEAKLGLSTGVRLVGTLRWPRGVPFQVVPKAPPDFSETDAELNARFPRCPP